MSLFQSAYTIDKSSNTFADNLAAFGLAFVLDGVADGQATIRLEDHGHAFAVICEPAIQPDWVEKRPFFVGAPFLITYDKKAGKKAVKGTSLSPADVPEPGGNTVVDYETEKTRNQVFFDWRKALSAEDKKKVTSGELRGPDAPRADWDVFQAINPKALETYNKLMAAWWRGQYAFSELLKVLLQMTAQTPNDLDGAEKAWGEVCKTRGWPKPQDATAVQLFNPMQGKGVNSPKAQWRDPNRVKGFWLLEWLKAVGLFHGGITRKVANPSDPRNAKDRKTYVLMPLHLEWGTHQAVMKDFRRAMVGSATAIKLDIFAALRYTQALLARHEGARPDDPAAELWGKRPGDLVSGMQTAFYKNLGQSPAVMNMAALSLPRWVAPRNPDDLAQLQTALDEHLSIVRGLDEAGELKNGTTTDQYALLCLYRDFLSANDLAPFFEFTTAYSGFVMSQYGRRRYVRPFTTTTLEVLFMNSDESKQNFSQITQSEGFKNVAYAIRHSTVIPQSRKSKGNKPLVDVRYGLGQQLARKAAYPAEFLAEVAEFIHLYNAENAQLRENRREPFRKNITTADIDELTELVDRFGSKVVCNLLVAYGYAREPYEGKGTDVVTTEEETLDAGAEGEEADETEE
jgi:hypothetical protein